MINSGRLESDRWQRDEELSPLSTMGNFVDIMLVLVCGLLIALIMAWNVDLKNVTTIFDESSLVYLDADEVDDQLNAASGYDELGEAYLDPKSGQVFSLQDDEI